MYTVSNRPYKLLANTRRSISQKVDPLETSTSNRAFVKCGADMSLPKPVFQQVNGKRTPIQKVPQENFPPQHDDLIKYLQDSWTSVQKEYEISKSSDKVPKVVFYQDTSSNQHLANFVPFDLEAFWGERFLRRIQQSS
ncbi:uncharacterized protein CDAR_606741 [Caerostris darwini]|uniref:Protein FAM195A n=2 Tax=Caerostris TaxID=172845 RepID=A0AAV4U3B4_9ARAC|nr:uncharacterized protein CEXT_103301 [Caerostris extrusa]GIY52228.1 uncharacterized protein CDAR_606741 [Caerostris darwini]